MGEKKRILSLFRGSMGSGGGLGNRASRGGLGKWTAEIDCFEMFAVYVGGESGKTGMQWGPL